MPSKPRTRAAVALALAAAGCLPAFVTALDNGLGLTPAMGYSSWNDCSSMRDDGPDGWCWHTEEHIKNTTRYFIDSGLADLGYIQMNIDEGWFKERDADGNMVEDRDKFPSGMKALGDWIKNQTSSAGVHMRYGLYTSRGTCQCGTGTYKAVGSHGFEKQDVDWMVTHAGADYLKVDSCCGSQDHATAFSDYAKFRDAMNATGTPVFFSLCGWNAWYAPPDPAAHYAGGASLGNSWRIAGDGSDWAHLTNCFNTQAAVAEYAAPGGWNDPDLLIGPEVYVGGQTDAQARAQFTLWSVFPTNLLISQNVLNWSAYALETYSNKELIAVNQDKLGLPARRIVGGDLSFPCNAADAAHAADDPPAQKAVQAVACDPHDPSQVWAFQADGSIESKQFAGYVLDDYHCAAADRSPVVLYPRDATGTGTCHGDNQKWDLHGNGTLVNRFSEKCLDVYNWAGPGVDVWQCNGGSNQAFVHTAWGGLQSQPDQHGHAAKCLAAREAPANECTNVWGRTVEGGARVLVFVNNGAAAANVTCDAACFAQLNISATAATRLVVRDLWAHADVATLSAPFSFSAVVNGSGFAAAFKLSPA